MKKFFSFLLKNTFIGITSGLTVLLFGLIALIVMLGAMSAGQQKPMTKDSMLVLDLSMNLTDTPPRIDLEKLIEQSIQNNVVPQFHLQDLVETIARAKNDRRIKGILIKGSFIPQEYGSSYPAVHELKEALVDFKTSDKPLLAYSVNPSLRDLYVMTVADEFFLNPAGLVEMPGLYSERMFYGNAFEKYGIGVQTVRVGDYKSGIEPYTRDSMSEESREASQMLLDELWIQILGNLASSRDVDPFKITKMIQRNPILFANDAVEISLCSGIKTSDEMVQTLIEITGEDESLNSYKAVSMADYIAERDQFKSHPSGDGIAVVYAEGVIVGGSGKPNEAGARRIVQNLREAHNDPQTKAIVLRVNSPGGGATASKLIQDELKVVKSKEIPLIVSMGGYAASGGYLISDTADHIFCHPHTITGSIGIYGVLFNIGEAASRFGITFDDVKTAPNADIYSISKPKTPLQIKAIQDYMDGFYETWIGEVAENRQLEVDHVRSIAGGRVWSGNKAIELGLADETGGLQDAIAYAAAQAELETYAVYEYPRKMTEQEAIAEAFGLATKVGHTVRTPSRVENAFHNWMTELEQEISRLNDPAGVYALSPYKY